MKITYDGGMIVEGLIFKKSVEKLITEIKPIKIVETGTYLGTGTTKILAESLQELPYELLTIEVNPRNCIEAKKNLYKYPSIRVLEGLSIPRDKLPSIEETEMMLHSLENEDIYVDFKEHERLHCYMRECAYDVPDDLLRICSRYFDYSVDLYLLDSSGHLGFIEFCYILSFQKSSCHFILDDVYHVKHFKSLQMMRRDPRFLLKVVSEEKFGFCIAEYDPRRG
jgi:hypothetical protein